MTSIKQIADRWEYIQGGFTYIDGNRQCDTQDTVSLSMAELNAYLQALDEASDDIKREIAASLKLGDKAKAFDSLPQSFLIMLDCDNEYLQSEPSTPLNDQFGSVAIALLYREVAAACGATSQVPDMMLHAIADKTGRLPIIG